MVVDDGETDGLGRMVSGDQTQLARVHVAKADLCHTVTLRDCVHIFVCGDTQLGNTTCSPSTSSFIFERNNTAFSLASHRFRKTPGPKTQTNFADCLHCIPLVLESMRAPLPLISHSKSEGGRSSTNGFSVGCELSPAQ